MESNITIMKNEDPTIEISIPLEEYIRLIKRDATLEATEEINNHKINDLTRRLEEAEMKIRHLENNNIPNYWHYQNPYQYSIPTITTPVSPIVTCTADSMPDLSAVPLASTSIKKEQ